MDSGQLGKTNEAAKYVALILVNASIRLFLSGATQKQGYTYLSMHPGGNLV